MRMNAIVTTDVTRSDDITRMTIILAVSSLAIVWDGCESNQTNRLRYSWSPINRLHVRCHDRAVHTQQNKSHTQQEINNIYYELHDSDV